MYSQKDTSVQHSALHFLHKTLGKNTHTSLPRAALKLRKWQHTLYWTGKPETCQEGQEGCACVHVSLSLLFLPSLPHLLVKANQTSTRRADLEIMNPMSLGLEE